METYEETAFANLQLWQLKMQQNPGLLDRISKGMQNKVNQFIPEKVHKLLTVTIQKMVEAVLFGSKYTTAPPLLHVPLVFRDQQFKERLEFYRNAAATEGAITGAGGILLGLADFPILIALKIKLLFSAASIYGHDTKDYKERLYILHIFQLTFSSRKRRKEIYKLIESWDTYVSELPANAEEFDWRTFQQEYRDYIDLAKIAQLIPFIGAAVGAVVNYKLLEQLGATAKNAYHLRFFNNVKKLDVKG
ncbi:EcsC family protein [Pedobacter sp. SYSU D00535]|uniref:EcsC family protein n=1 Tax=Pedobacter sp. SYSU D00535 TaxID=2810308 RepID=UPI001A97BFEC|nr:EcsC family protein [Pedobacter sp. SYSU D00535]